MPTETRTRDDRLKVCCVSNYTIDTERGGNIQRLLPSQYFRKRFHDYKPFKLLRGKFSWRNFGASSELCSLFYSLQDYCFTD